MIMCIWLVTCARMCVCVSFLGTSGQNVSDIVKYSSVDDHLEILENTLRLRHLAPTAPDTLGEHHTHSTHTHCILGNGVVLLVRHFLSDCV